MARDWLSAAGHGSITGTDFQDSTAIFALHSGHTIERTLVWVGFDCTFTGVDLSDETLLDPIGWYLSYGPWAEDPSGVHPGLSPWSTDHFSPVAMGFPMWDYAPAYTSRHINGTLSLGITGDFTVDEPVTPNQTVYARASSYVDSHAQRTPTGNASLFFAAGRAGFPPPGIDVRMNVWYSVRILANL